MKILLEDELLHKVDNINHKMQRKLSDSYLQAKLGELNRSYRSLLRLQREAILEVYRELCAKKPSVIDYQNHLIKSITIQKEGTIIESDKGAFCIDKNGCKINVQCNQIVEAIVSFFQLPLLEKEEFYSNLHKVLKHKPSLFDEAIVKIKAHCGSLIPPNIEAFQTEWDELHNRSYYVSKIKKEVLEKLLGVFLDN